MKILLQLTKLERFIPMERLIPTTAMDPNILMEMPVTVTAKLALDLIFVVFFTVLTRKCTLKYSPQD